MDRLICRWTVSFVPKSFAWTKGGAFDDAPEVLRAVAEEHSGYCLRHRVQPAEREFFIDNLLVRIYFITKMVLVDRPCSLGVSIPFSR